MDKGGNGAHFHGSFDRVYVPASVLRGICRYTQDPVIRLGFYDHNRDINPRNQRALTLLGLLLECSLILFTLDQKS